MFSSLRARQIQLYKGTLLNSFFKLFKSPPAQKKLPAGLQMKDIGMEVQLLVMKIMTLFYYV